MASPNHSRSTFGVDDVTAGTPTTPRRRGDGPRIAVLLADDQRIVRNGLRRLLEEAADVVVTGEAGTGRELLHLARATPADVAVIDLAITDPGGLEVVRALQRSRSAPQVVAVSRRTDERALLQALQSGARAFVLKDSGRAEFELAIRAAAHGDWFVCPRIADPVVAGYLAQKARTGPSEHRLTPRQREIMKLVAEGRTSREIARHLGRSLKTVEAHRTQIMRRLGVQRVAGIVQAAVRMGLVEAASRSDPGPPRHGTP